MTAAPAYKLDHALSLAEQGFRVFPLQPDSKVPKHGLPWKQAATTNAERIKSWWQENPNFNIGVATGAGTLVVDVDVKKGKPGLGSLAMLEMIDFPESYRVKTPSGGIHVYLKTDRPYGQRANLPDYPGIDIRCDGGYVVGPGSTLEGKPYEAAEAPLEPVPAWFDDYLRKARPNRVETDATPLVAWDLPENIARAQDWLTNFAPEAIEGAGGDATTYEVACQCRDFGLSESAALEAILEHWNEQKAAPPWMPDELSLKVANAYNYGQNAPGSKTAAAEFGAVDIDEGKPPARKGRSSGCILDYDEMTALPEPSWLIEGVLQERTAAVLFGRSNTFKSFLAISMALSVAIGRPWHGQAVKPGRVLYVATEGANGVGRNRIPAWLDYHSIPYGERLRIHLYPEELLLDQANGVDDLITKMHAVGEFRLVIFDVQAGTMAGSENDDTVSKEWVRANQKIIRKTGAAVLSIAHTGWNDDTRARGHTHTWGSFDTRLRAVGDKDKRTTVLSVERHKDADSTGEWGFRMVEAGESLVPIRDKNVRRKPKELTPQQKKALITLHDVTEKHGMKAELPNGSETKIVPLETWKEACSDAGLTESRGKDAERVAFKRATETLFAGGFVKALNNNVYLSEDD